MNNQSKVIPIRTPETIEQEAADWLAKLDSGNLSKAGRKALRDWLSQDSAHVAALKSLVVIWGDMDVMLNDFQVNDSKHKVKTLSLFSRFDLSRYIMTAFAFVLVSITVLLLNAPEDSQSAFYVTTIGDQRLEVLEDGSSAHLNTDSMIEAEYTESIRIIRLLRGEAFFDVAHDPDRPFIVYVGDRLVQAIGTKFVVRLTSENILVTVAEGQVELSKRNKYALPALNEKLTGSVKPQEAVLISEGEAVEVFDNTEASQPKAIEDGEINRRLSWVSGELVFKNERLEQVISEVGRYIPARILIADDDLRDILVSGRFQIGDTDALLEAIEVSLSIKASRDEKVIRLQAGAKR